MRVWNRTTAGTDADMRGGRGSRGWYWLLLVPLVGVLIPPVYNVEDPRFIGLPFFYWYQLLWVPISAALTYLVYVRTRRREP